MRADALRERILGEVTAMMADGVNPWRCPWVKDGAAHQNLVSRRPYSGVNAFWLAITGMSQGKGPYWVTFRQAQQLGGAVKKGARGTPVFFFAEHQKDPEDPDSTYRFAKVYYVFDARVDCDDLVVPSPPEAPKAWDRVVACEATVAAVAGLDLRHGGQQAFYSPLEDYVQLPPRESFRSPAGYYGTLFHELTHWTGHKSRLARETLMDLAPFGSPVYSREELVAEMGAAMLCVAHGIEDQLPNCAAYLQGWLKKLQEDQKALFWAAGKATAAVALLKPELASVAPVEVVA